MMTTADGHHVSLTNRRDLEITGVERVSSFDVHVFELVTAGGLLKIEGDSLHMKHFDMAERMVRIEGTVRSMTYHDKKQNKHPIGRFLK